MYRIPIERTLVITNGDFLVALPGVKVLFNVIYANSILSFPYLGEI